METESTISFLQRHKFREVMKDAGLDDTREKIEKILCFAEEFRILSNTSFDQIDEVQAERIRQRQKLAFFRLDNELRNLNFYGIGTGISK